MNVTWVVKNEFKTLNLFLKLFELDPTKPDKSVKATAQKLVKFLRKTMYLQQFEPFVNLTSDYAIFSKLGSELNALGWHDLENKLTVCSSHDGVNMFKNALKNLWKNIENKDGKGN